MSSTSLSCSVFFSLGMLWWTAVNLYSSCKLIVRKLYRFLYFGRKKFFFSVIKDFLSWHHITSVSRVVILCRQRSRFSGIQSLVWLGPQRLVKLIYYVASISTSTHRVAPLKVAYGRPVTKLENENRCNTRLSFTARGRSLNCDNMGKHLYEFQAKR